ncbi:MAG TPA: serine/threonine-protein kinase [Mycobacteriales bacterium]|nr:serine/threonine-protein kinase [Mycobacteriales bacterium]
MTEPTQPWSTRVLDNRYRLGDRLGGGAAAEVYRALDERLQRPVAVKLFRGDAAAQLQRHEAEMRTLASLDHPSLVGVYDAGTDDATGAPFLVMQLVEGSTLADELHRGRLAPERAATYGAALADALAYVHERGFVHRDVKPANVLISGDGRVHLADFGIARLVDSAHETRTGDVLGTPGYFSPEQVTGDPVGPPTDVYALGIVLIECLTGQRPFEGGPMEVALARVNRQPDIPTSYGEQWHALLNAMTLRDPARRPSAATVADSLRRISAGEDLDRTVAMTPPVSPTATQVLPATAVATQLGATTGPAGATAAGPLAPSQRRSGPSPAVIVFILLLVVAAIAVALVALRNNSSNTTTHFTPGKPKLHPAKIERDMRNLERLVHR